MGRGRGIPKRTPEQKAEVGAFINRLYEISGATTNVEFAGRAGLYGSNVGEYRSGTTMPDAYTLIRLMSSVGVELRAKGEVVDLPAASAPLARPESTAESVAELLAWQEEVMADLAAHDKRLAQIEKRRAQRPGKAATG